MLFFFFFFIIIFEESDCARSLRNGHAVAVSQGPPRSAGAIDRFTLNVRVRGGRAGGRGNRSLGASCARTPAAAAWMEDDDGQPTTRRRRRGRYSRRIRTPFIRRRAADAERVPWVRVADSGESYVFSTIKISRFFQGR